MSLADENVKIWSFDLYQYLILARPGHWVKHIFIIPGAVLAFVFVGKPEFNLLLSLSLGFAAACLLASANYVMNGWLDGEFDRFHPSKKDRPAATGQVMAELVHLEYGLFIFSGLILAWFVSLSFFVTAIVFILMAVIYNVPPLRFKDHAFLDVLTESINNPLRLMMGWAMVSGNTIPPSSLFISYWFGGAFLMAAKRLAEYRLLAGENKLEDLLKYRKSFVRYTENSLIISSFTYGLLTSFFTAAFLIKHRNEFLFVFPFLAALFAYYLWLALDSRKSFVVQNPEKLHTDTTLMTILGIIVLLFVFLSLVDVPLAEHLIGIGKGINYNPWK